MITPNYSIYGGGGGGYTITYILHNSIQFSSIRARLSMFYKKFFLHKNYLLAYLQSYPMRNIRQYCLKWMDTFII